VRSGSCPADAAASSNDRASGSAASVARCVAVSARGCRLFARVRS